MRKNTFLVVFWIVGQTLSQFFCWSNLTNKLDKVSADEKYTLDIICKLAFPQASSRVFRLISGLNILEIADKRPQWVRSLETEFKAAVSVEELMNKTFSVSAKSFWLLAATMVLITSPSFGQFRSSIEGAVTDSSGAVVAEAQVSLTNTDTGVSQTTQSNGEGLYRFPSLPPGSYKLTATKQGFQMLVQENVSLLAQETRTVPLLLKVGQTSETVTVTGENAPIQLSEAKVASDISARELKELPLPGRNILSILSQTPGVTGVGNAQQTAGGTDIFSLVNNPFNNANGQRGDGNAFYLDNTLATSNPDPGSYNLTPNPDSIQELHVAVNDYSAESGRSGSLSIQAVTKAGTNGFHGSLFEYHQNNVLTARDHFQSTIDPNTGRYFPAFRRNEFGGSIGGPIQHDKMFFFFSWDQKRSSSPTLVRSTVETPQFVDFMKTNYPDNISTQLLTNFPAIESHGLTDIQTAADIDPNCAVQAPVAGMPCDLPIRGATSNTFVLPNNGLQWSTRIDRYFGPNDRLYGNFYRKTPDTISPNVRPAFNNKNSFAGTTNYVNVDWTHTFSANLVNDAAMGFTRISGLGSCSHCEVPSISLNFSSGLADFGTGFAPAEFIQNDFHWRDVLSFTHGRHQLKAGFDIFRDQENDLFSGPTQRPGFLFLDGNATTGLNSVFDFANDQPTQETGISYDLRTGALARQSIGYRTGNFGFFVQDDFKLKPNFSVNAGLRWDFNTNPYEESGQMSQVILGSGSNLLQQIAGASVGVVPNLLRDHRIGYFAPRVSFAWDPTRQGKLSVRGGVGVFFNRAPNIVWSDAIRANPPFIGNITADTQIPSGPQPVFGVCQLDHAPFSCPIPSGLPTGLNARGGALVGLSSIGGTDPGLKQAYNISRFFGVQYGITPNWIVEADYTGSQDVHLYVFTDRNRCLGCIDSTGAAVRPNPFFAAINYTNNDAWSQSNGATFSILHRFSQSFSFQAAFNLSRTTSVVDSIDVGRASSQAPVYDPYNLSAQRGPAAFDIPKSFTLHGIWELPKLANMNAVIRNILGGWQWSGAVSLQSGYPYTVTDCSDLPDGINCVLPDVAASEKGKSCDWRQFLTGCLDPTAFSAPATAGVEGNVGRNSFRGPGFANVDFSTMKYFPIPWFTGKEGARLQIRGEFFNLFNRTNLRTIDGIVGNTTFAQATDIYNPRTIQVGARIEF